MIRSVRRALLVLATATALVLPGSFAYAAAPSKAEVLRSWTEPTADSTAAWNKARLDQSSRPYRFDWSTDYCSFSPDRPLGFNFELSCWHHDFGYRNYIDLGTFGANKARLDRTFHADLRRACAGYARSLRPACNAVAWIYYQAVVLFGSLATVRDADLTRASKLLPRT